MSTPAWRDCDRCNYDLHVCPGCGENLPHGIDVCDVCREAGHTLTIDPLTEAARAYAEQACYQNENIPIAEAGFRAGWNVSRDEARRERDVLLKEREKARRALRVHLEDCAASASPRPLTAADITDSHVLSARLKANSLGWFRRFDAPTEEWRQILVAGLTEPTRPEGAEKVEAVLHQYWAGDINGDELANRIAEEMNR